MSEQNTIVVSAVNIVEGGTLTILRDCLSYLSKMADEQNLRVVALVNRKELAYFSNIEYIEIPWSKKRWVNRIWTEYISMKKISKSLQPVHLWLSLHDTTPNVVAERRAVYCHNSTPFNKLHLKDLKFDYKIVLFSLFYKILYRVNIKKNSFVIVQQNWLREVFSKIYDIDRSRIIVAYPTNDQDAINITDKRDTSQTHFFYPSLPRQFKNFEVICEAVKILNAKGVEKFSVDLTLNGGESKYSEWVYEKYNDVEHINFTGLIPYAEMVDRYSRADCLIFPSNLETWGLPISEFSQCGRPMILADLPYAHETANGAELSAFFNPNSPSQLAELMHDVILSQFNKFKPCPRLPLEKPFAQSWEQLLSILLEN